VVDICLSHPGLDKFCSVVNHLVHATRVMRQSQAHRVAVTVQPAAIDVPYTLQEERAVKMLFNRYAAAPGDGMTLREFEACVWGEKMLSTRTQVNALFLQLAGDSSRIPFSRFTAHVFHERAEVAARSP
jgi:hypothetical protein